MKNILIPSIVLLIAVNIQAQIPPIDSGLVAYYPFNGNALDESGFGNNGNPIDVAFVEDRDGNPSSACLFNGITSNIIVPDDPSLDIVCKISIAGWMKKFNEVPWASMVTKGGEFDEENNYTIHNSEDWGVVFTSNNEFGTGGGICQSTFQVPIDTWTFITFTWDGMTAKFFKDGQPDTLSFIEMPGEFQTNTSALYIGVDYPGDTEFFDGCLDDIRIYNRDLTVDEILYLYDGSITQTSENFEPEPESIRIYPNPASDFVFVEFDNPDESYSVLTILNFKGQMVYRQELRRNDKVKIDLSNLSSGTYLVKSHGNFLKSKILILR